MNDPSFIFSITPSRDTPIKMSYDFTMLRAFKNMKYADINTFCENYFVFQNMQDKLFSSEISADYVCARLCECVCVYVFACVCVCMRMCMCMCMRIRACAHVHTCTRAHVHTCTRAYVHTCIRAHVLAQWLSSLIFSRGSYVLTS